MGAIGVGDSFCGAVRSAGQEQWGVCQPFRQQDDGVQFDAVAHWDHEVPLGEIEGGVGRFQLGGDVAGQVRLGAGGGCQQAQCDSDDACTVFQGECPVSTE